MSDFSYRVEQQEHQFSNSQHFIAKYISNHLDVAAFRSLRYLAQKINVSTTSIIRFSKILGYDGFTEMQHAIQKDFLVTPDTKNTLPQRLEVIPTDSHNKLLSDSFENDILNIQQTLSIQNIGDLEESIRLISSAKTVYILGLRASFSLAYYMASRLCEIRHQVRLIQSSGMLYPEEIIDAGPSDVCVAYLFPRYSKISSTILSWMKNAGCKTIIFTSRNYQPISGYGDIILPCSISSLSYKNSLAGPLCLSNYLITSLVNMNPSTAQEVLEKTESILNQGFYLGL